MSKTKGGGSTRNGRDSHAQRLGVKAFGGTKVLAGAILVRRRGTASTPATTSAVVATTRCSPRLPDTSSSAPRAAVAS